MLNIKNRFKGTSKKSNSLFNSNEKKKSFSHSYSHPGKIFNPIQKNFDKIYIKSLEHTLKYQKNKKIKFLIHESLYCLIFILSSVLWGLGQIPDFFYIRYFGLIILFYIIFYRKHYLIEAQIFGWIAYSVNFYWLFILFKESGKLPIIFAVGIPAFLTFYYALQYPAISFITKKFCSFHKNLIYLFPIIFTCIDFLYPKIFKHSIADSQLGFLYFVQLIDITGMSGLIIIIMLLNLGLFLLIKKIITRQQIKYIDFLFIIPFIIALIYGILRFDSLNKTIKNCETTYACMIQGNITGKQKQDDNFFQINIDRYNRLTKEALDKYSPEFIIWPESVFNRYYDGTPGSLAKLIHEEYPVLILGISYWAKKGVNKFDITNSCLLLKKRIETARYDKKHLLIFGEYIPFEKTFPFLRKITPLTYSMKKGTLSPYFEFGDNIRPCVSICFEDIFPDEIRKSVNGKYADTANLMINLTNDSWYGRGLGPLHHSVIARLRAIENRRSFYRCTATGLTTASDFTGKVVAKGKMWKEEIIAAKLPLYDARTIYSKIGELLSYICIAATALIFIYILAVKRKWP